MTLNDQAALAFYDELGVLNEEHGISLVQQVETKKIYLKKVLRTYNRSVFEQLKKHPVGHMPRLLEVIEDDGRLILIEEYLSGDTLEERLEQQSVLPKETVLSYALRLCDILQQLHSLHPPVIHRDIKPSNIILASDGTLSLIDLNAAKHQKSDTTRDTVLLGTFGYAAPEQYGFSSSGVQTDIYAVGVLMNVMLTGHFPADGIYSGRLGDIIRRCIALSPEDRYPQVAALRRALVACQKAECLSANRPTDLGRFLPPGLRGGKPGKVLASVLGYAALIWLGLGVTDHSLTGTGLLIERLIVTACFLAMALYSGNYLGVQSRFCLFPNGNPVLRLVGILLADVGLFLLTTLLLALLQPVLVLL